MTLRVDEIAAARPLVVAFHGQAGVLVRFLPIADEPCEFGKSLARGDDRGGRFHQLADFPLAVFFHMDGGEQADEA